MIPFNFNRVHLGQVNPESSPKRTQPINVQFSGLIDSSSGTQYS